MRAAVVQKSVGLYLSKAGPGAQGVAWKLPEAPDAGPRRCKGGEADQRTRQVS